MAEAFYASLFSSIKCVLFYALHKASELTSRSVGINFHGTASLDYTHSSSATRGRIEIAALSARMNSLHSAEAEEFERLSGFV